MKCAGLAAAGAILALTVRRENGAYGALVAMTVVLAITLLTLELMKPVLTFARSLQRQAGLSQGVTAPVIKCLAIGFLTEIGKNVCEDAGEKTIGGVLQLAGGIAGFYVMLPLLQSVLDLMAKL